MRQPFQPIVAVIEHLRTFIVRFGRVDLASEMNDETRFPEGAYVEHLSQLEMSLARGVVENKHSTDVVSTDQVSASV